MKYKNVTSSNPSTIMCRSSGKKRNRGWKVNLYYTCFLPGECPLVSCFCDGFLKGIFSTGQSIRTTCQSGRVKGCERWFQFVDRWKLTRRQCRALGQVLSLHSSNFNILIGDPNVNWLNEKEKYPLQTFVIYYTNLPQSQVSVEILETYFSDHKGICLVANFSQS